MYKGKKILALIPARGGSKGVLRKNVRLLAGKPLIAWTIEQVKQSTVVDRIITSTDDDEIASVARKYGSEAPFKRPLELAHDTAKSIDVIQHTLKWLQDNGGLFDILVLLQPTSPLREVADIDLAVELLFKKNAAAIVSVCKAEHCSCLTNRLSEQGSMKDFIGSEYEGNQQLSDLYRLNGAIYVVYVDFMRQHRTFFGDKTFAYIMPPERSVDIDTETDFEFAEFLLKKR